MPHSPLYEVLLSLLWQLPWVAAGGVVLIEQVWNVARPLALSDGSALPFWVWTLPNVLLGLLTLALLAGAAATNRRATSGHAFPSPQQHHV